MAGETRTRGPWLTILFSVIGFGVVAATLAYCLQASSELGSFRRSAPAVESAGSTAYQQRAVAITPGREVIGAIVELDDDSITVRSSPDSRTVVLKTSPSTQVTTTHGRSLRDIEVGDVVMIQVNADHTAALAIYAGQISVAGSPSGR